MSILVSVFVIVSAMKIFGWIYFRYDYLNNVSDTSETTKHNPRDCDVKENSIPNSFLTSTGNHMIYVINTLTNQGKFLLQFFFPNTNRIIYLINNRRERSFQSQLISNPSWCLGFVRHGFGQFVHRNCHFVTNNAQTETVY